MPIYVVFTFPRAPQGHRYFPDNIPVSWVSLAPGYSRATGENDMAVVGTLWSIEFSDVMAPMCIYGHDSDTNLRRPHNPVHAVHSILTYLNTVKRGLLVYSVKALTTDVEELLDIYTDANGPSVYQKCIPEFDSEGHSTSCHTVRS